MHVLIPVAFNVLPCLWEQIEEANKIAKTREEEWERENLRKEKRVSERSEARIRAN